MTPEADPDFIHGDAVEDELEQLPDGCGSRLLCQAAPGVSGPRRRSRTDDDLPARSDHHAVREYTDEHDDRQSRNEAGA